MRYAGRAIVIFLMTAAACWGFERAPSLSKQNAGFGPYVPPSAAQSVKIGNFYLRRKAYRGALSRFLEALHSDPHYAPVYLGLARLYEKQGKKNQALSEYKKYLEELPSEQQAERARAAHRAIRRLEHDLQVNARSRRSSSRAPR